MAACKGGHIEIVNELIAAGAGIDTTDNVSTPEYIRNYISCLENVNIFTIIRLSGVTGWGDSTNICYFIWSHGSSECAASCGC